MDAQRGTALAPGQRSLQGTGDRAALVSALRPGDRVRTTTSLRADGRPLDRAGATVLNGGPELVRDGRVHVTQRQDGMVHPGEPSFAYGWVLQRNPRTFAGVDARGRTMVVTVDGRQLGELGLVDPRDRLRGPVARHGRRDEPGRRRLHSDGRAMGR